MNFSAGFKKIKGDATLLAENHHIVMSFVDQQKRNPSLLNNSDWVQEFQNECQDMINHLFFVQKDIIKGLISVGVLLNIIHNLPNVKKTHLLQTYFNEKEKVLVNLHNYFFKLLRDVPLREQSRRKNRLRGFLGNVVSDKKEEKQEIIEGRCLRSEFIAFVKNLKKMKSFYSDNKNIDPAKVWAKLREHLIFDHEELANPQHNVGLDKDKSILYHSKHLFMITIDMAFDLKEALLKINRPEIFQETIDDLENMEKKQKKLAKRAA